MRTYENVILPVYVINSTECTDRLACIKQEFSGRSEFEVHIVKAIKHPIRAMGLWQSIKGIIEFANRNDDEVLIICEDDHQFTKDYDRVSFISIVINASILGANLLLGGVGSFEQVVPLKDNLYWIDNFFGAQFLVIYRGLFQKILDEPFGAHDTADDKLSELTSLKMVVYPFISVQKEFGYPNVTSRKGIVDNLFKMTSFRMKMVYSIYQAYVKDAPTTEQQIKKMVDNCNEKEVVHKELLKKKINGKQGYW